jgi:hypothetical protein
LKLGEPLYDRETALQRLQSLGAAQPGACRDRTGAAWPPLPTVTNGAISFICHKMLRYVPLLVQGAATPARLITGGCSGMTGASKNVSP